MTREELKKQAALQYRKHTEEYGDTIVTSTERQLAFEAGWDAADENPKNPWISVEERLPEKARGLYELEDDEQHKMVLFRTDTGKLFIGYLDAEEIWRTFTVPFNGACPIDAFTWSRVTHWMPNPQIKK